MATKSKTVEIEEKSFSITSFPARKGIKVQAKLIKYALPFIHLLEGEKSAAETKEKGISKSSLAAFISGIEAKLDDKMIDFLVEMVEKVKVSGIDMNDTTFNETFASDYTMLWILIWEVIKHNNFLSQKYIGLIEVTFQETMKEIIPI